jgi:hypothetical protein
MRNVRRCEDRARLFSLCDGRRGRRRNWHKPWIAPADISGTRDGAARARLQALPAWSGDASLLEPLRHAAGTIRYTPLGPIRLVVPGGAAAPAPAAIKGLRATARENPVGTRWTAGSSSLVRNAENQSMSSARAVRHGGRSERATPSLLTGARMTSARLFVANHLSSSGYDRRGRVKTRELFMLRRGGRGGTRAVWPLSVG